MTACNVALWTDVQTLTSGAARELPKLAILHASGVLQVILQVHGTNYLFKGYLPACCTCCLTQGTFRAARRS